MEDLATQPATQFEHPTEDPKHLYDESEILLLLHPTSPAANQAAAYIAHRYPQYAQQTTNASADICLRYTVPPKNPKLGYTFGRNPIKCDIALGQQTSSRRVSNLHFRIFMNEAGVVMLEDLSTNGTWVDNVCLGNPRAHDPPNPHSPSRKRSIMNSTQIFLALGPIEDELKFVVEMRTINVAGWRRVCEIVPGVNMGGNMGPPLFRNHGEIKQHEDPFALPPEWSGKDGSFDVAEGFIGKGAFAVVRKVTQRNTGQPFAIKIINKRVFSDDNGKRHGETRRQGVMKEVEIMEMLNHDHIVKFHDFQENKKQLFIRMEYIEYGDLSEYLKNYGTPNEEMMQEVTRQLVLALEFIHKMKISHRDIKPENILIKSLNPIVVKLSDFGLAKMIKDDESFLKTFCGTMLYLAPEVFPAVVQASSQQQKPRGKKEMRRYNQACDMWSLGCVLYFMLTNVPPFQGENQEQIQARIIKGSFDKQRLIDRHISTECIDFLSKILRVEPSKRMSEHAARKHPWLAMISGPNSSMLLEHAIAEVDEEKEEPLPKALEDKVAEWEELKDQIQVDKAEEIEASQGTPSQKANELAAIILADIEGADSPDSSEGEEDVEDEQEEPQLFEVTKPLYPDADGDIEIENSQEQHTRLEGEKQKRFHHNLSITQQRRPTPLRQQTPKAPEHPAAKSLASPPPSPHGSSEEMNEDEPVYIQGFSQYIDPSPRAYSEGPEMSDIGSSGILGHGHFSPGIEKPVHFEVMQHSSEIVQSVTSSHGDHFRYEHITASGPSVIPTSGRGSIASRRRTPGPESAKSLAGMRTMVGNLNVTSESSILHKKGSGMMSTDDRISKKKKSDSSIHASRAVLAMSTVDNAGQTTNTEVPKKTVLYTIPSSEGEMHSQQEKEMARKDPTQPPDGDVPEQPAWGRLIPTKGSIEHSIIPLVQEMVSYGRSAACNIRAVDDKRVSKHHIAMTLLLPGASLDSQSASDFQPQHDMQAWAKIGASNGVIVNSEKYFTGETIRIFDGDEIMVFRDHKNNEFLSFRVEIMIGKRARTEEDFAFQTRFMADRKRVIKTIIANAKELQNRYKEGNQQQMST